MNTKIFWTILTCTILMSSVADARSFECRRSRGAAGYRAGVNLETTLLNTLWLRFGDCQFVDDFITAVTVPFAPRRVDSTFMNCRNEGIADTMFSYVNQKMETCLDDCTDSGASIGSMGAYTFCGIKAYAIEDGAAPNLCTLATRTACRAAFISTVTDLCPNTRNIYPLTYNSLLRNTCDVLD